jgi:hypothetical protein
MRQVPGPPRLAAEKLTILPRIGEIQRVCEQANSAGRARSNARISGKKIKLLMVFG